MKNNSTEYMTTLWFFPPGKYLRKDIEQIVSFLSVPRGRRAGVVSLEMLPFSFQNLICNLIFLMT